MRKLAQARHFRHRQVRRHLHSLNTPQQAEECAFTAAALTNKMQWFHREVSLIDTSSRDDVFCAFFVFVS